MGRHIQHHRAKDGTAAHLRDKFYVVTAVSNPRRYRTRYELYNDFAQHMQDSGAPLYTVECAYGQRAHTITDAGNPRHIQLRTRHELWHKENLLNIAVSRLPSDWAYVAWVDADVMFTRKDWVNETIQQLQTHQVVQMFSHAQDLGPHYEPLGLRESFARSWQCGAPIPWRVPGPKIGGYYGEDQASGGVTGFKQWHPGLAWAWRRSALDAVGGFIDWAAVGAGDFHMAWSLVEHADFSIHPEMHGGYRRRIKEWENQCKRHIHKDVGCVEGTVLHYFHGAKVNRKYWDRWKILVHNGFDPDTDLKKDTTGVYQLQEPRSARQRGLRDGLRNYFAARDEDNPTV